MRKVTVNGYCVLLLLPACDCTSIRLLRFSGSSWGDVNEALQLVVKLHAGETHQSWRQRWRLSASKLSVVLMAGWWVVNTEHRRPSIPRTLLILLLFHISVARSPHLLSLATSLTSLVHEALTQMNRTTSSPRVRLSIVIFVLL